MVLMSRKQPFSGDWAAYYAATAGRPPRPTLLEALHRFAGPGFAVDLGCGDGRDAIELLRRGWRVLAVDAEKVALDRLRGRPDLPQDAALEMLHGRFEAIDWPECDLVNASFALPLCPPEHFPALWARIRARLIPGGRFAGQLYGERDGWAGREGMTFHRREEVEALLRGLEVEHLAEEESDAVTPRGTPKHWHIYHVVARQP
jgi:SAM-dependent methyltransferase